MLVFYLAARYGRKDEIRDYADVLREHGYAVASTWHDLPAIDEDGSGYLATEETQSIAHQELMEIDYCDVLLAFTEAPSSPYGRGGRHVELGFALGRSKAVRIIGPIENIFHCLAARVHVPHQKPRHDVAQFDSFGEYLCNLADGNGHPGDEC